MKSKDFQGAKSPYFASQKTARYAFPSLNLIA
jgi:hypothetical protein